MKNRKMRVAAVAAGCVALSAGALAYATSDGDVINACADAKSGQMRLLADGGVCDEKREVPVAWNVQGPQGLPGPAGSDGSDGSAGVDGASAYDIWVAAGNEGTPEDFLASLRGPSGSSGTPVLGFDVTRSVNVAGPGPGGDPEQWPLAFGVTVPAGDYSSVAASAGLNGRSAPGDITCAWFADGVLIVTGTFDSAFWNEYTDEASWILTWHEQVPGEGIGGEWFGDYGLPTRDYGIGITRGLPLTSDTRLDLRCQDDGTNSWPMQASADGAFNTTDSSLSVDSDF